MIFSQSMKVADVKIDGQVQKVLSYSLVAIAHS